VLASVVDTSIPNVPWGTEEESLGILPAEAKHPIARSGFIDAESWGDPAVLTAFGRGNMGKYGDLDGFQTSSP